jgi:hypothetical protein
MAESLGLVFNWNLVEVEGVGHSGIGMAPAAIEAICESPSIILTPLDDAHIKENNNNYGSHLEMKVDADYGMRSFFKFDLSSLADVEINYAALKLNVTDTSKGYQVLRAVHDQSWSEDTLTNNNKPASFEQISTGYGGSVNVTTLIRLTDYVQANRGSVISFMMETDSSDGFYFSSKESGHAPEIVIREVEDTPATDTITLIEAGDGWSYSEVDPQPDPDWNVPGFDDSEWSSGSAPLGFGDPISYGTELNDTDGCYYFRTTFYIAPGVEYESMTLYVASDNYAMVYLNGILVDDDTGSDHEFRYWNRVVTIPGDYLLEGTNIVAAYVYNSDDSNDAYFDLRLDGEIIGNQRPTLILHPGWNLISLPYVQTVSDIESVFSSISGSYDAIQCYDATDAEDPWKHYLVGKPPQMNDLHEVSNLMGIWIHITESEDVLFHVPGVQATQGQTISLDSGWNLVGYPRLSDSIRTEGLNNTLFGTHVDLILWHNTTSGEWIEMGEIDYFEVGMGYWVHSKVDATWDVPL